jgi:anti-sigma B factor antagonist
MHLQIDTDHRDGFTVLRPQGDIDVATGPALKDRITETLVAGGVHLVVDLQDVEFIESTGLGALVGGRRRAEAVKGSLSLVCVEDRLLQVFRLTGLDTVFTIFDTVDAAVAPRIAPRIA